MDIIETMDTRAHTLCTVVVMLVHADPSFNIFDISLVLTFSPAITQVLEPALVDTHPPPSACHSIELPLRGTARLHPEVVTKLQRRSE